MKTAVVYTRVSSEEQVTGTSLDSQLNDCLAFAHRQGLSVIRTFTDAGVSAKTANRPALKEALEFCAREKPTAFVVWKLDRLSRNTSDGLVLRTTLKKHGTDVLSATENITQDPVGELVSTLLLSVAQFDNQQRADRCKRGMVETAMRGGWCYKAPMGFKITKAPDGLPILEITDKGRILQHALKSLAAGIITKAQYYATCESLGIPPKRAVAIPSRHIYAGIICGTITGGQPIPAAFPGMITPEEREVILANKRVQHRVPDPPEFHGLLICAECGTPLVGYRSKGHLYYKCRHNHINVSNRIIGEQIRELLDQLPILMQALGKAIEIFRVKAKEIIAHERTAKNVAEKEVAQAQTRLDKLTDAYLDGKIDDATYERKAAEYRRTITEKSNSPINAEYRINKAITQYQQNLEKLRSPSGLLQHLQPQARQSFLALVFGLLSVSKDKHVTPYSNSSNNSLTSALSLNLQAFQTKKDGQNPSHSSSLPVWWSEAESNRRHPRCERGALPTELPPHTKVH